MAGHAIASSTRAAGALLPLLLVHLARPTPCSLRPNQGRSTGCYDVRPDLVLIP